MSENQQEIEPNKTVSPIEIAELCERIAYDRKGEQIVRLDMTGIEGAESDHYIICTGLSEPHIGAIADRIRREVRKHLGVHAITVDGTPRSQWIIVDFGSVMVHVLTDEARLRYQLEELWGDAPCLDVVAKLDDEHKKRKKASQ